MLPSLVTLTLSLTDEKKKESRVYKYFRIYYPFSSIQYDGSGYTEGAGSHVSVRSKKKITSRNIVVSTSPIGQVPQLPVRSLLIGQNSPACAPSISCF